MTKHNDVCIAWRADSYGLFRIVMIWKERLNGGRWEIFETDYDSYLLGAEPPHYPVPTTIHLVDVHPAYQWLLKKIESWIDIGWCE